MHLSGICLRNIRLDSSIEQKNVIFSIEMIGWIALGFVPTLGMLEYTTRKLAKRMLVRLFVDSEIILFPKLHN
jgi:hypothetical protein